MEPFFYPTTAPVPICSSVTHLPAVFSTKISSFNFCMGNHSGFQHFLSKDEQQYC